MWSNIVMVWSNIVMVESGEWGCGPVLSVFSATYQLDNRELLRKKMRPLLEAMEYMLL